MPVLVEDTAGGRRPAEEHEEDHHAHQHLAGHVGVGPGFRTGYHRGPRLQSHSSGALGSGGVRLRGGYGQILEFLWVGGPFGDRQLDGGEGCGSGTVEGLRYRPDY